MSEHQPSFPGEGDPARGVFFLVGESVKKAAELTAEEREAQVAIARTSLREAQERLDESIDSTNNRNPIAHLHGEIDTAERHLRALGVDPSMPTEKEVAEAYFDAGRLQEPAEDTDTADPSEDPNASINSA